MPRRKKKKIARRRPRRQQTTAEFLRDVAARAPAGVRVVAVAQHGEDTRYRGEVALSERVVPHEIGVITPGVCAMFLICFEPSQNPNRHAVVFAFNRKWTGFEEDARCPGATHEIVYSELKPEFEHSAFNDLIVLRNLGDYHIITQATLLSDEQAVNICKAVSDDLCDGWLYHTPGGSADHLETWTARLTHHIKTQLGVDEIDVAYSHDHAARKEVL